MHVSIASILPFAAAAASLYLGANATAVRSKIDLTKRAAFDFSAPAKNSVWIAGEEVLAIGASFSSPHRTLPSADARVWYPGSISQTTSTAFAICSWARSTTRMSTSTTVRPLLLVQRAPGSCSSLYSFPDQTLISDFPCDSGVALWDVPEDLPTSRDCHLEMRGSSSTTSTLMFTFQSEAFTVIAKDDRPLVDEEQERKQERRKQFLEEEEARGKAAQTGEEGDRTTDEHEDGPAKDQN